MIFEIPIRVLECNQIIAAMEERKDGLQSLRTYYCK